MNRHARYALFSIGVLISGLSFHPAYAQETTAIEASKEQDDGDDNWAGASGFEITVTNLTRGQQFTPTLVATHKRRVRIFEVGKPAGLQLATLAEEGNTGPLAASLSGNPDAGSVVTGSGLTNPGQSTTIVVERRGRFTNITVAAILLRSRMTQG